MRTKLCFAPAFIPLAAGSRIASGSREDGCIKPSARCSAEAIKAGGSSISDYVDSDGREGSFQFDHRVYQRTGEPCVTCGTRVEANPGNPARYPFLPQLPKEMKAPERIETNRLVLRKPTLADAERQCLPGMPAIRT